MRFYIHCSINESWPILKTLTITRESEVNRKAKDYSTFIARIPTRKVGGCMQQVTFLNYIVEPNYDIIVNLRVGWLMEPPVTLKPRPSPGPRQNRAGSKFRISPSKLNSHVSFFFFLNYPVQTRLELQSNSSFSLKKNFNVVILREYFLCLNVVILRVCVI